MATYRTVYMSFWTDPKVDDEFTPEDKYFYLYLLTNPHTNICGCYEISMKQMVRETGYNEDTVKRLLTRMETVHGVVQYDSQTKEVLIPRWSKYNWVKSKDTFKGVEKVSSEIKSDRFRYFIISTLANEYGHPLEGAYRGPTGPVGVSVTVPVTDTVSDSVTDTDSDKDTPKSLFDVFIQNYPNQFDIDRARAVWNKLNPDADMVIKIMDGLSAWKESAQWEDPQFIPYPANWLMNKRWEQKPAKRIKPKAVESGKTFPGQNYEQKQIPRFEDLPNLIPVDL